MKHIIITFLVLLTAVCATAEKPATRFAWGADAGASVDMTGNDMSAVDLSAYFGLSRGWVKFLGVGAEANIMVSSSDRAYPLFVDFRTNFRNRPSLVFWDLRAGLALNYLEHKQDTGFYGATGIGINLARSAKFCSHIIIGYTFRGRGAVDVSDSGRCYKDIHSATVRIGVVF